MKKKSYWLSISVFVLILIWTVYYYAMQYTGGFADLKDSIVCGIVGLIDIPDCLFCEQAHSEKIIATANSTLIVFFIFCPPIKTIISNLLAANSILCCLRTASPQGIAALAAQVGVATLTERSDATFSVMQFSSADWE